MVELEDSEYFYIMDELYKANELLDKLADGSYCFNRTQAKEDNHMAQLTGGQVSVEDSKAHSNDEYGRKKVAVTLSFAVGDGEEYQGVFDLASTLADRRVKQLLGNDFTAVHEVAGPKPETPAVEGEAPKPARRPRRTAAEIAADAALAKAGHPKGAADPADIGGDDDTPLEEVPGDPPSGGKAAPSGDPADIGGDEEVLDDFNIEGEAEEIEEITDAALNAAVQRKNAELSDPEAIRGVIKQYNPEPTKAFQLREIPADKRADFLTKLAALKKASA